MGVEVPCPPDMEEPLAALIEWCIANGVDHINLNELEFSPTNAEALTARRYEVLDDTTMRVKGSRETALRLVERFRGRRIAIHFCTSPFKDAVQLKNRLRRQAQRVRTPVDEIGPEGTLQRGVVLSARPVALLHRLRRAHGVPASKARAEPSRARVLVHPRALLGIAEGLAEPAFVSEIYPTANQMEVERLPLNDAARAMGPFEAAPVAASRFP